MRTYSPPTLGPSGLPHYTDEARAWRDPHAGYVPPAGAVRLELEAGPYVRHIAEWAPAYGGIVRLAPVAAVYVVGDLEDTAAQVVALELRTGFSFPTSRTLPLFDTDGSYAVQLPQRADGGYPIEYVDVDGDQLCHNCATGWLFGTDDPEGEPAYAGRPDWLHHRHGIPAAPLWSGIKHEPDEHEADEARRQATGAHLNAEDDDDGHALSLDVDRLTLEELDELHRLAHEQGPTTRHELEDDKHDPEPEWADVPYYHCADCYEPVE